MFILSKEIKRWKAQQFKKSDPNSNVEVFDIKVSL